LSQKTFQTSYSLYIICWCIHSGLPHAYINLMFDYLWFSFLLPPPTHTHSHTHTPDASFCIRARLVSTIFGAGCAGSSTDWVASSSWLQFLLFGGASYEKTRWLKLKFRCTDIDLGVRCDVIYHGQHGEALCLLRKRKKITQAVKTTPHID
jgi:hypothetical protein